jgi:hypothetical protein
VGRDRAAAIISGAQWIVIVVVIVVHGQRLLGRRLHVCGYLIKDNLPALRLVQHAADCARLRIHPLVHILFSGCLGEGKLGDGFAARIPERKFDLSQAMSGYSAEPHEAPELTATTDRQQKSCDGIAIIVLRTKLVGRAVDF